MHYRFGSDTISIMWLSSVVKVVLSLVFLLITLFLFVSPTSLLPKVKLLYYQKINPNAGVVYFEKQYKTKLEEADRILADINKVADEMMNTNRDSVSATETQTFIKRQKKKIDTLFKNREKVLRTIIAIDDQANKIALPSNQIEFYKKRRVVDVNQLNALLIQQRTTEIIIEGSSVYYHFWNYFLEIAGMIAQEIYKTGVNSLISKKTDEFDTYYLTDVAKAKEKQLFSKDIFERMEQAHESTQRIVELYEAYKTNPYSEDTITKLQFFNQGLIENEKEIDEIYQEWLDNYIAPGIYLQKKMSNFSFELWSNAYEYAKKQNMMGIFAVWNNSYPGYKDPKKTNTIETVVNSQVMRDKYYQLYDDPDIQHIRTSLNTYLKGDQSSLIPFETKTKKVDDTFTYGLDSFDKKYYKSKFVVVAIDDYIQGGSAVTLLFQDKPDRLFVAWVYAYSETYFVLRGFWSATKQNATTIKRLNTEMKDFINDTIHSL